MKSTDGFFEIGGRAGPRHTVSFDRRLEETVTHGSGREDAIMFRFKREA